MGFVRTPDELQRLSTGREQPQFHGAEALFVFWETRPETVARLLPPPLEPMPYPLATAMVAYYPSTNFGPPYYEGALCLGAQYQGVPGNYCIAMPVTDDMAMAGGREAYGYPKKMAEIEFRRSGDRCTGRISRHGRVFFEIDARLGPGSVDPRTRDLVSRGLAFNDEAGSPVYLFKYVARPGPAGFDYPPRLIRQNNVLRPTTVEWADAEIRLPTCETDPWHEVEVLQVLGSVYTVGHNTMLDGEVVAEVDATRFMPYAWAKWDPAQLRLPGERSRPESAARHMDAA